MLHFVFYLTPRRLMCLALVVALALSPSFGYSQGAFVATLPDPGKMMGVSEAFSPVLVRGLVIHADQPLQFDLIVDSGNDSAAPEVIRGQSEKIVQYFLAALTVPEDSLWVNLSPYENDRIMDDGLGETVLGRDMLAQDYVLKQLTASMIYPDHQFGKEFWARVYREAYQRFGTTDIPVDAFNKVWIVPEKASVFESQGAVYVTEAKLKVMLDWDYLAARKSRGSSDPDAGGAGDFAKDMIRQMILPAIETEVNQGKNFATLRQVYYAAILAKWYRQAVQDSLMSRMYVGQNKTSGVTTGDKTLKEQIYQRYIEAYKKGVFSYIREETDPSSGGIVPRKYFSGGLANFAMSGIPLERITDAARLNASGKLFRTLVALKPSYAAPLVLAVRTAGRPDPAMLRVGGLLGALSSMSGSLRKARARWEAGRELEAAESARDYERFNAVSDQLFRLKDPRGDYVYRYRPEIKYNKVTTKVDLSADKPYSMEFGPDFNSVVEETIFSDPELVWAWRKTWRWQAIEIPPLSSASSGNVSDPPNAAMMGPLVVGGIFAGATILAAVHTWKAWLTGSEAGKNHQIRSAINRSALSPFVKKALIHDRDVLRQSLSENFAVRTTTEKGYEWDGMVNSYERRPFERVQQETMALGRKNLAEAGLQDSLTTQELDSQGYGTESVRVEYAFHENLLNTEALNTFLLRQRDDTVMHEISRIKASLPAPAEGAMLQEILRSSAARVKALVSGDEQSITWLVRQKDPGITAFLVKHMFSGWLTPAVLKALEDAADPELDEAVLRIHLKSEDHSYMDWLKKRFSGDRLLQAEQADLNKPRFAWASAGRIAELNPRGVAGAGSPSAVAALKQMAVDRVVALCAEGRAGGEELLSRLGAPAATVTRVRQINMVAGRLRDGVYPRYVPPAEEYANMMKEALVLVERGEDFDLVLHDYRQPNPSYDPYANMSDVNGVVLTGTAADLPEYIDVGGKTHWEIVPVPRKDPAMAGAPAMPLNGQVDNGGIDIRDIRTERNPRGEGIRWNDTALQEVLERGFVGFVPVLLETIPLERPALIFTADQAGSHDVKA